MVWWNTLHIGFLHELCSIRLISSLPAYYFLQRLCLFWKVLWNVTLTGWWSRQFILCMLWAPLLPSQILVLVRMQAPTAELHPDLFQEWYSDFWYTCYLLYKSSCVYVPCLLKCFGCQKGMINCLCAEICIFFLKKTFIYFSPWFFFFFFM